MAANRPKPAAHRDRHCTTNMGTLNAIIELVSRTLNEWRSSGIGDLVFNARNAALLAAALLAVIAAIVLVWRSLRGRLPGRTAIALPAVLPRIRRSPLAFVRHAPFLLFLAGLPFFCLALAVPCRKIAISDAVLAVNSAALPCRLLSLYKMTVVLIKTLRHVKRFGDQLHIEGSRSVASSRTVPSAARTKSESPNP